ncbi:MAG: hypothetical protein KI792_01475 [Alphaproteobacteria bacterium]|nr:hypothetical protein [Alphaproteobacteria bacterium SS10]
MRNLLFSLLALTSVFAIWQAGGPVDARAAEPRLIGTFRDWSAYEFQDNSGKVCYMASRPIKDEGNYTRRGEIYALVTHRPDDRSFDVASFIAGYTHQAGSDVSVQVGSSSFDLFTQGDTAWTRDTETDQSLVSSIRKGNRMVVRGTSSRGTLTTDTYSLSGSSAAYEAISKACGVTP